MGATEQADVGAEHVRSRKSTKRNGHKCAHVPSRPLINPRIQPAVRARPAIYLYFIFPIVSDPALSLLRLRRSGAHSRCSSTTHLNCLRVTEGLCGTRLFRSLSHGGYEPSHVSIFEDCPGRVSQSSQIALRPRPAFL